MWHYRCLLKTGGQIRNSIWWITLALLPFFFFFTNLLTYPLPLLIYMKSITCQFMSFNIREFLSAYCLLACFDMMLDVRQISHKLRPLKFCNIRKVTKQSHSKQVCVGGVVSLSNKMSYKETLSARTAFTIWPYYLPMEKGPLDLALFYNLLYFFGESVQLVTWGGATK